MSLDLGYDDGQEAIRSVLDQFCAERCSEEIVKAQAGSFPRDLWRDLCQLGVLEAATPEGEGGALEVAAAFESLGKWVVPGPWPASLLAAQVLDANERVAVASGELVVSVGEPPLMPWAQHADLFLALAEGRIWRARTVGAIEPVQTLGGEPWGRCEVELGESLDGTDLAVGFCDAGHAAYLAAAGERLLDVTAEHARTRVQFGRAIGEFQAVAHPMADCSMRLAAAALARAAAWRLDRGPVESARHVAAAARLSANRAALETVHVSHQVFGAVGITLEGPIYHFTRRIRQLASSPPADTVARSLLLDHFGVAGADATASTFSQPLPHSR